MRAASADPDPWRIAPQITTDFGALPGRRPVVKIRDGERTQAINEAEVHLVRRDPGLFQRGGKIVRLVLLEIDFRAGRTAPELRIVAVRSATLRVLFSRAVDLKRFNKTSRKWQSCDCPRDFAAAYRQLAGYWRLPELRAVVTAPTFRLDGTLIEQGYDCATGIFYAPGAVAENP